MGRVKETQKYPLYETTRTLKFTVLGNPKGQGRPRFSTIAGHVKAYDPESSRAEKATFRLIAQQAATEQHWEIAGDDTPVGIEVHVHVGIPKSKQKWFRAAAMEGVIAPLGKPDADNIVKLILDSLSGVLYKDDKNIFDMRVVKHYSETPRVEVAVTKYYLNYNAIKTKAMAMAKAQKEVQKTHGGK